MTASRSTTGRPCATASSGGSTGSSGSGSASGSRPPAAASRRPCRAGSRMPTIRRPSPMPSPTSGRSCATWTSAASSRPRSSPSRSAWARALRAALWLDRFKALDEERGTGYYPRLRFLLGDYSLPTLDRAHDAVAAPPGRRERARARRAQPVPHAVVPALQDPLRPPDQRLRQPAPRRAGAARRPALRRRDARVPADGRRRAHRGGLRRVARPTCRAWCPACSRSAPR